MQSLWKSGLGRTSPFLRCFSSRWVYSTWEVETLRMAEARAWVEERARVVELSWWSSSELELGIHNVEHFMQNG